MHADGMGWIWVPDGLKDGPLPAHYEPLESPVANTVYGQQTNPAADPKALMIDYPSMRPLIIAIDGPSGAGKGTVARAIAAARCAAEGHSGRPKR